MLGLLLSVIIGISSLMASSSLGSEREDKNPRNSKLCCFSDLKVPSWFSFFWLRLQPSSISSYCSFFSFLSGRVRGKCIFHLSRSRSWFFFFTLHFRTFPPPTIFKRYLIWASLGSVLIFSTFGSLFGICQLLSKRDDCSIRSPGVFYRFFFLFSSATLFDLYVIF